MKKTILILLILCAIPLYSYNVFLLVKGILPHSGKKSTPAVIEQSFDQLLLHSQKVVFVKSGRSPFLAFKEKPPVPKQISVKKTSKHIIPTKAPQKPAIKITGIMWSASNPLAMVILPDGSSTIVKEKNVYGDILVKKIEKNRIQVILNKTSFWIDK